MLNKLLTLIPEKLRSRKLGVVTAGSAILIEAESLGIPISPELKAILLTVLWAVYLIVMAVVDGIAAYRTGGIKAVAEVLETNLAEIKKGPGAESSTDPSSVDKPEG